MLYTTDLIVFGRLNNHKYKTSKPWGSLGLSGYSDSTLCKLQPLHQQRTLAKMHGYTIWAHTVTLSGVT